MILFSEMWGYFSLYGWKDILEVLILSSIIYYFSCWLKKDNQKPLLLSFYGYCTIITASYYLNLVTLSTVLITFAPVVLVLFIVLHQETLQKNFIALHTLSEKTFSQDWIEHIIRSCLVAVGNNKPIHVLIEKHNDLTPFLNISHRFESTITQGLLDLLIQSDSFEPEKIIILKSNGTLVGINGSWKKSSVDTWLATEVKEQEEWAQDALFFTAKSDALYFKIDQKTRIFTLLAQGKILETVSAERAQKTIKQYLGHFNEKGDLYEQKNRASSTKQSLT